MMTILKGAWTGVALLATVQAATAAPPKVSGTYALMMFTQCEARFTVRTTTTTFLKSIVSPSGAHTHSPTESGDHTHPTTSGPVSDRRIVLSSNGELAIGVGLITFSVPATGASTGPADINMSIVRGDVLRINQPHSMAVEPESLDGTFSIADTSPPAAPNTSFTFTFDPDGAAPPMTFTLRHGDVRNGIARTLYMVRKEDAQCLNAITATKQ